MAAKVMKWGNSLAILIPAFAARSLGLTAGAQVRMLVLDDEIRIKPAGTARQASADVRADSHADQVREVLPRW